MDEDTILIITGDQVGTRAGGFKSLKVEELAANVRLFIKQIGHVLEQTPKTLGDFHFEELEISAEITAKGSLAILGTGGEVGGTGGLRFVFRRSPASGDEKQTAGLTNES
jgi:hypothetical protein